jgi:hypothetical protein
MENKPSSYQKVQELCDCFSTIDPREVQNCENTCRTVSSKRS